MFRRVVSELNPGLTRLAQTYVPASLADEVVQETWAAVIESLDSFEGESVTKNVDLSDHAEQGSDSGET